MRAWREHPDGRRRDWLDFTVHGVCGLFAGAMLGVFTVWKDDLSGAWAWAVVAVGALVLGLLAACFGDRFWGSW